MKLSTRLLNYIKNYEYIRFIHILKKRERREESLSRQINSFYYIVLLFSFNQNFIGFINIITERKREREDNKQILILFDIISSSFHYNNNNI